MLACAYAKWTGRLCVRLATSGPGGIHLLNGLYDAKHDRQPLLAITGLQFHSLIDTHTQQDVEFDRRVADVCVYNTRIMSPAHGESSVTSSCRSALAYRGATHVTMAFDLQSQSPRSDSRSERNVPSHVSGLMAEGVHVPTEDQIARAAAILNEGLKIAILAGRDALGAQAGIETVGERLDVPVIKPLLAKSVLPDDHPFTTGGIGLLGTALSQEALVGCDTLLIIGPSFPCIEYYPKPGKATCVQIELDPKRVSLRYPVDAALVGDARRVLQVLLPRLDHHQDRSFLETAQKGMQD